MEIKNLSKITRFLLADHYIAIDQVTSVLNLVQGGLDIVVPRSKFIVNTLFLVQEHHDALKSVDFGMHSLIDHHVANFLLCALHTDAHKLSQPL